MNRCLAFVLLLLFPFHSILADFDAEKAQAEEYYSRKSYSKALEIYSSLETSGLSPEQQRWVAFRIPDCKWRAVTSSNNPDATDVNQAIAALNALIRDTQREEEKDLVWAEVNESLGDYYWRENYRNPGMGQQYYQAALDWWAGQKDIETARARYIAIIRKLTCYSERNDPFGWFNPPLELLENYSKIAKTPEDKAYSSFLLARGISRQGDPYFTQRAVENFQKAIEGGADSPWFDMALWEYAELLTQRGRLVQQEDGSVISRPDFPKAIAVLERLIRIPKESNRYWDQAKEQLKEITDQHLQILVSNVFLPGSEVTVQLISRNIQKVDLTLWQVDLTGDLLASSNNDILENLSTAGAKKIRDWQVDTGASDSFEQIQKAIKLDPAPEMGAYILEARSGQTSARQLILVSDASVITRVHPTGIAVYFAKAANGAPLPRANVRVTYFSEKNAVTTRHTVTLTTDPDGLARYEWPERSDPANGYGYIQRVFVTANSDNRQAFVESYGGGYNPRNFHEWRTFIVTDRPAYRPGDTVHWKATMRSYNGETISTPKSEKIHWSIRDPQGAEVAKGDTELNSFGSCWDSLEIKDAWPLGDYRIYFSDGSDNFRTSRAALFRLEEYKLPEFKVSVNIPEENGKKKLYRLGDTIEAEVQADYYFGGPVANAKVEVLVRQSPYFFQWVQEREFPWLYQDQNRFPQMYGGGQIVQRETLTTDAHGKAKVSFPSMSMGNDMQYTIEARVTDSSRREIVGTGEVRVSRQGYFVEANPEGKIYGPQSKVKVIFKAADINRQPQQVTGTVRVKRMHWDEVWISPEGKKVSGPALDAARQEDGSFPSPPANLRPWRCEYRGYREEDVTTAQVTTGRDGSGEFSFTPGKEGYYQISWSSPDKNSPPVQASASVWVTTAKSVSSEYISGGIEIIFDKDTVEEGKPVPILLAANGSGRYALLSSTADNVFDCRVVHLEGSTKLVMLDVKEEDIPNFWVTADMIHDYRIYSAQQELIVPPVRNFLKVQVDSAEKDFRPREKGSFAITTTDWQGKPVSAELAFSVFDQSLDYIQQADNTDPRQFFFGDRRNFFSIMGCTLNRLPYLRPQSELARDGENAVDSLQELAKGGVRQLGSGGTGEADSLSSLDAARGVVTAYSAPSAAPSAMADLASAGAPMNAPMAFQKSRMMLADKKSEAGKDGAAPMEITVRNDFRSSIAWMPDLKTDENGKAKAELTYPDSTTTWVANVDAATDGNQFGLGSAETRTEQPLIARLEAPRFFLTGDQVVLSGVFNNNTDKPMSVKASLEVKGVEIIGKNSSPTLSVPAHGEARADWLARVTQPGPVTLKLTGDGGKETDAMEKTFTAYERGIEKTVVNSGKLDADDATLSINLPVERGIDSTHLMLQITPSVAVTMLDSLPYLLHYPYGCVEQTMSRFLPAVVVEKTLHDLGIPASAIEGHDFGGIEKSFAESSHAAAKTDLKELPAITAAGLHRLYDFQKPDGGWGWWKDSDPDVYMTGYVLWGLNLAKQAGVDVEYARTARAAQWLRGELIKYEDQPDMQAWLLHSLVVNDVTDKYPLRAPEKRALNNLWDNREKLNAFTRALLALSCKAAGDDEKAKVLIENLENGVILDQHPDQSVLLGAPGKGSPFAQATAHWGSDGVAWRWSDGSVETTAFCLRALLAIDPENKLVEPTTNWLVKNRRGAQWNNTRDTAICLLALTDYLKKSGELKSDMKIAVEANGKEIFSRTITPKDIFSAPSCIEVPANLVRDGENTISLHRTGNGAIYFTALAKYFTKEKPITAAGNEIFIKRQYFREIPVQTLLKGTVYENKPFPSGGTLASGDRLWVVITIEAKNNYEYLLLEDLKPAGLEAVEVRSGEPLYARELSKEGVQRNFPMPAAVPPPPAVPGGMMPMQPGVAVPMPTPSNMIVSKMAVASQPMLRGFVGGMGFPFPVTNPANPDQTGRMVRVYQELRDRKVALFIDKLPQGTWEIRYPLRAEIPGTFSALPVMAQAMYVPEIRANGDEVDVKITDAGK